MIFHESRKIPQEMVKIFIFSEESAKFCHFGNCTSFTMAKNRAETARTNYEILKNETTKQQKSNHDVTDVLISNYRHKTEQFQN